MRTNGVGPHFLWMKGSRVPGGQDRTHEGRVALLPTKLMPPQLRMDLVPRPHLLERLQNMDAYKLALIRSPAGFGKTTLLSQWWQCLNKDSIRAAWLNLDESDRDVAVFTTNLAASLERAGIGLDDLPHTLRLDPRSVSEGFFFETVCDAVQRDTCPNVVLILEDYHLAVSSAVDRFMQRFLSGMPDKFHVVISSRSRPGFPLSKLRSYGRLLELDDNDLKFIDAEVRQFFGTSVPSEQIKDLNIRTQGWPVALQLARLWLQRGADTSALPRFSGSVQAMAAYLTDQIIADLPEDDRNFLIATSIVEVINGDLADALTGLNDGWQRLRTLHQIGVPLIPMSAEQDWFRYHPTLTEYLRSQAHRQGERAVKALHLKASHWFAAHDDPLAAIYHAVEAKDMDLALDLANQVSWVRLILAGKISDVIRLKELLSLEVIIRHPRLLAAIAYLSMKEGRIEEGGRQYRHAVEVMRRGYAPTDPDMMQGLRQDMDLVGALDAVYQDANPAPDILKASERLLQEASVADYGYRGLINNMLALLYYRRGELISARAAGLNSVDQFSRADMGYAGSFVLIHLGMFSITQGYLDEAWTYLSKSRQTISQYLGNDHGLHSRVAVFEAEIMYERNNLEKANDLIFEALPEIETSEGWVELFASAYRTAAFIAYADRGFDAAVDALAPGFAIAEQFSYPRLKFNLSLKKMWLFLWQGKTEEARTLSDALNLQPLLDTRPGSLLSWREAEEAAITLAWLELQEGRGEAADRLLSAAELRCVEGLHRRRLIQVRILRALVAMAGDDLASAAHYLKLAINDARQGGFIRLFLDFGSAMRDLLKKTVDHMGVATIPETVLDWIAEIISAFEASDRQQGKNLSNLILTDRERDILDELKQGGSNKALARRLDMTDNAVKFHLRNLYRKLGVHSRRMAVVVAQKRGF